MKKKEKGKRMNLSVFWKKKKHSPKINNNNATLLKLFFFFYKSGIFLIKLPSL
jgi:hypothetical protein